MFSTILLGCLLSILYFYDIYIYMYVYICIYIYDIDMISWLYCPKRGDKMGRRERRRRFELGPRRETNHSPCMIQYVRAVCNIFKLVCTKGHAYSEILSTKLTSTVTTVGMSIPT